MKTTTTTEPPVEAEFEPFRTELTGFCYRMLGSSFEAEDAVQETMVRAWRAYDRFEGRSSLRSWLYRIATNVCLTMLDGSKRRARPMDLSSPVASVGSVSLGPPLPETAWVEPMPDTRALPSDPAERAETRESVRLALIAALQHLPPRQRAVLILREVLSWRASEVAELLDTTVASVNSALQRARATLAATGLPEAGGAAGGAGGGGALSQEHKELLTRYIDAFERYDMDSLTSLLHEDATQSMPPYDLWLRGPEDICAWMQGPGIACRDSRLIPTWANGSPAFAQYRVATDGKGYMPWAMQVLEVTDGRVSDITVFLTPEAQHFIEAGHGRMAPDAAAPPTPHFFPLFGMPLVLDV